MTVKNLSAAIGVTEPALYRHFKNKAEIVKAMMTRFDGAVSMGRSSSAGLEAVKTFVRNRIEQVCQTPDLASVMFAEEIFMDDSEFRHLMLQMVRRHKTRLNKNFQIGQERGEIRADIAPDILFRLVLGPVRLLIKQWGMTGQAFDLRAKGDELLEALVKILTPTSKTKQ